MEYHEAANIFPLDDENLDALVEDIRQHGQHVAIELLDGKILDGRRRFLACQRAGVTPETVDVEADDPIAYVVSLNLHRRHLDIGQRAMVAARAREVYAKQAKERMKAGGGDHKSESAKSGGANLPTPIGRARDKAGEAMGVGGRTVDYATKVLDDGVPELATAVDASEIPVSVAAEIASLPYPEQPEAIAQEKKRRTNKTRAEQSANREIPTKKGVGLIKANEAIDRLKSIPKSDGLRDDGLRLVMRWIKSNR